MLGVGARVWFWGILPFSCGYIWYFFQQLPSLKEVMSVCVVNTTRVMELKPFDVFSHSCYYLFFQVEKTVTSHIYAKESGE